jgi:transposase
VLTEAMNGFRGTLGITVIQCRPRDPEAKGLVERANGYLETSFLPGRRLAGPGEHPPAPGAGLPPRRPVGR